MSMDLIAATVVLTAVFLVVAGGVGLALMRPHDGRPAVLDQPNRGKLLIAVLLVVYFLGITDVFIITQQYNLAFTNLTAGLVLAAVQYFAGQSRSPERSEQARPSEARPEVTRPAETPDSPRVER